VVDAVGTYFDHHGLLLQAPFATLDLLPLPDTAMPSRRTRLRRLTKADTEALQHALETQQGQEWDNMLQKNHAYRAAAGPPALAND
jgi:hypothetical protein